LCGSRGARWPLYTSYLAPSYPTDLAQGRGFAVIVFGAALFFVCEANAFQIHDFGGHIWYLVGFLIAGSSLWWFGAFDTAR
jgi:hypothetical protein